MTRRGRWQLAVVVLTALPRIVAAALGTPVMSPDGERYRNEAIPLTPFDVHQGQGPGVLTQVLHLLPLPAAIVAQTVLTVAVWGVAALYAGRISSPRLSWPAFLIVHIWSLSPWFLLWDTWVLTEAPTLAGCALAAVGVAATRTGTARGPVVAVVGLAVAVMARPLVGAMLLPLVALIFVWPPSATRLRALSAPLISATALGMFATWQALAFMNAPSPQFSYLPEPESIAQIQATDRFVGRGAIPGYLELAKAEGMPSCPPAEAVIQADDSTFNLSELRAISTCPEFDAWLADGGLRWTKELTNNTGPTVSSLVSPSYWARQPYAPYVPSDDRMAALQRLLGNLYYRAVIVLNAFMIGATALVGAAVLAVAGGQRLFYGASLAVVTAVSVYAWGTDGIEYWRHLLPGFAVLLPLAIPLLSRRPYSATRLGRRPSPTRASGPSRPSPSTRVVVTLAENSRYGRS